MTDTLAWLGQLPRVLDSERRAVLVVTTNMRGSTPRESGAAMLVARDTTHGTIGGGHLEFESIRAARDALAHGASGANWLVRFPLAARLGQCCGGVATVAFSIVDADRATWVAEALECVDRAQPFAMVARVGATGEEPQLVVESSSSDPTSGDAMPNAFAITHARSQLVSGATGASVLTGPGDASFVIHLVRPERVQVLVFGNGHVARALVHILGALPVRVRWIDERENDFPASVPGNVEVVISDTPESEIADAPPGALVAVMTHSHALDYTIVECALRRGDFRYVGLIGSAAKRAQFERRWRARGGDAATLAHLACPIGRLATALPGKEPGVIALGVAAEIMALREDARTHQSGARADVRPISS
ncbi:MAG TPA: xanthine dehydrogenase accessory protein XdhC [Casimicrobiaceae bacterium]|nr:xanthine dehydrogenase accessory protein XdhC [Casimicrobiaceae bacterium]